MFQEQTMLHSQWKMLRTTMLAAALAMAAGQAALAQDITLQMTVQNRQFSPSELRAPANKPIVIVIKNNDATPMEFESVSLRVEKIIAPKSQGSVRVRALSPGRYEFFDDFNQSTRGALIVQ
jgi:heme/copper-type cytochrome/quinol oxidase subunit 2